MENGEKFLKAERTVNQLRQAHVEFVGAVSSPNVDKKGIGFNIDERFCAFSLNIHFDSYKGYYGNSGCSTVISFADVDEVKRAFVKVLNLKWVEIFNLMADEIEKENSVRKDAYIADLRKELKRFEQ